MRLIAALIALLSFTMPAVAGENCTCRYKEADVAEGQTICMQTPNGSQMATCARVLNNTSWKFLGQPCPTAGIDKKKNSSAFDYQDSIALLRQKS